MPSAHLVVSAAWLAGEGGRGVVVGRYGGAGGEGGVIGGCGCLCIISDQTLPLISVKRKSSVLLQHLSTKGNNLFTLSPRS